MLNLLRCSVRNSLPVFIVSLLFSSIVVAQKIPVETTRLSVNQQDALELLKTLARSLKSEPDKLTAAVLQAQIADALWQFDKGFAHDAFCWSFEAASRPAPENLSEPARVAYVTRQASSIRQVLTRIGTRDSSHAESLLKTLQKENSSPSETSASNNAHSELLLQIALELAPVNPESAMQLGLLSLSGTRVSPDFGRLLFAMSNVNRSFGDRLFRAAVSTLRRNEFVYDSSLISLVNYVFSANGAPHTDATFADAQLLANYFVDAAWRQSRGNTTLPDSTAMFYNLVQVRGVPIVSKYASERLPELQGQLRELASRLTSAQVQQTTLLQASQQQQITIANRNTYDVDEQIERAGKEKDPDVRDSLLNSVAHNLMREDSERALKVAGMIESAAVRREAEDDIHLALVQTLMRAGSFDEARKTARKFGRPELHARILIELANKAVSTRDTNLALELLSEASDVTSKAEPTPDKATLLLNLAQQFSRIDTIRGFETLGDAIKIINQLKPEEAPVRSALTKPRPLRIKTYTVLNGTELSTSDRATLESINFSQLTAFVNEDYTQTRLLANKLEQSLWRAKFLTAVGSAMLNSQSRSESGLTSANGASSP